MIEKGMGAPYYSYKTLNELSRRLPGDRISIICGCDVLNEVTGWKEFDTEIWPKFDFIGVSRGDDELPTHIELNGVRKEITTVFSGMNENISSTEIRNRIKNGEDCSRLLCQDAIDIINKHKLYI
jgi:nicotinate (nicotinamide) nucleotide adenylyltransferase